MRRATEQMRFLKNEILKLSLALKYLEGPGQPGMTSVVPWSWGWSSAMAMGPLKQHPVPISAFVQLADT